MTTCYLLICCTRIKCASLPPISGLTHAPLAFRPTVTMAPLPFEIDTSLYLTNTTPTKRRKKNPKTGALTMCKQGRCIVCKSTWVTTVCRECQKGQPDPSKKQYWCCKSGTECFDRHVKAHHPDKLLRNTNQVSAPLLYYSCCRHLCQLT